MRMCVLQLVDVRHGGSIARITQDKAPNWNHRRCVLAQTLPPDLCLLLLRTHLCQHKNTTFQQSRKSHV